MSINALTVKKLTLTISALTLLALAAGILWYQKVYMPSHEQNAVAQRMGESVANTQNMSRDNTVIGAADIDTSNWKEYCNEEYGFCVKIPQNWIINKQPPNNALVTYNSKEGFANEPGYQKEITDVIYCSPIPLGAPAETVQDKLLWRDGVEFPQNVLAKNFSNTDKYPFVYILATSNILPDGIKSLFVTNYRFLVRENVVCTIDHTTYNYDLIEHQRTVKVVDAIKQSLRSID